MSQRPFSCPECSTFVRHDWLDECAACGASLNSVKTFADDFVQPEPKAKSRSFTPGVFGAAAVVAVVMVAGSLAVFGTNPGSAQAAGSSSDTTTTTATPTSTTQVPTTTTTAAPLKPPATTAPSVDGAWVKFTDSKTRFRTQFPAKPQLSSTTKNGVTTDVYLAEKNGIVGAVTASPRPAGQSDAEIIGTLGPYLVPADSTLASKIDGKATGYSYEDLVINEPSVTMKARIFVTKKQVYVLLASTDRPSDVDATFTKLTASFAVLSKG